MPEADRKDKFQDRVSMVLDEISLGIRWECASINILVYRSEKTKNLVQAKLVESLRQAGNPVSQFIIDNSHFDVPFELREFPLHEQVVFFVSGLQWGGGRGYSNAYRALNMHRETLIEEKIKAIFWITVNEARQLVCFSPDFWAFRHKVVEFVDLPSSGNARTTKSIKRWHINPTENDGKDLQVWMNTAEKYCDLGCMDEAIASYRKALRKYPAEQEILLRIAEIYLAMRRIPAADRILKKVRHVATDNGILLKELERLTRSRNSIHPITGGISEVGREIK